MGLEYCYIGPDGRRECIPLIQQMLVPPWVVEGGKPPPQPDPRWVDIQIVALVDTLAVQVSNEAVRTRLVSVVDEVVVELTRCCRRL